MQIGQQSSSFLLFPDQVGGGETLSQTLALGNTTDGQTININNASGTVINWGTGTAALATGANNLLSTAGGLVWKPYP